MDGWMEWNKREQRQEKERGVSAEGRRRGAAAQVSRPTACARGIKSVRSHRVCLCARVGAFVFVHGCVFVFVCARAHARARGRQMTAGTTRRTPRRSRNGQLLSQSATKAEPEGRPARRRRRRPAPLNPLEIVSPRTPPSRSAARASCWVSFNIR